MKKAIVSGANGFIGSALCKELVENGYFVYAIVKDCKEKVDSISGVEGIRIIYCGLENLESLYNKEELKKADVIFHFGWAGVSSPEKFDLDVQLNNVKYTSNILALAVNVGARRLVFASSVTEYECLASLKEQVEPPITYLYSCAKIMANGIAKILANKNGIEYLQIVISNVYGVGDFSKRFLNESLKKILRGQHTEFTSAKQTYDFIYIEDAKRAIRLVAEKGCNNKVYYLGSQNPRPLKDFLNEMRDAINPNIILGIGAIPHNGVSLDYSKEFDLNAIKIDTGFVPKYSFRDGIIETFRWLQNNEKTILSD